MEFNQVTKLIFYMALLILLLLFIDQITGKQNTMITMLKELLTFG